MLLQRDSAATARIVDILAIGALGLLLLLYRYGPDILDPTSTGWLLGRSDPAANLLAWFFYRQEAWSFPWGRIASLDWPLGTSVALTDALPLLAIPFKLIRGILPADFHYWGLWLALCHVLQGVFGYLLMTTFSRDRLVRFAGAVLMLLMPVWLHRLGHLALSAHWVVVAAWWSYRREDDLPGLASRLVRWGALFATAALIHPYLWVMAFGIAMAAWSRSWRKRRIGGSGFCALMACVITVSVALWYVSGTFILDGTAGYTGEGLGQYSLNLDAPFNSSGTSMWVPPLPLKFMGQYEGYAYLGLCLLVLLAAALGLWSVRSRRFDALVDHREALVVVLGAVMFALSPVWTLGDHVVLRMTWGGVLGRLGEVFRATGRFFWIGSYALLMVGVASTVGILGARRGRWVLAAAALITFVEMQPMIRVRALIERSPYLPAFDVDQASQAMPPVRSIVLVPPRSNRDHDWVDWSLIALREGASMSGTYLARRDESARATFYRTVDRQLTSGDLDAGTLYVLPVDSLDSVQGADVIKREFDRYGLVWRKQ